MVNAYIKKLTRLCSKLFFVVTFSIFLLSINVNSYAKTDDNNTLENDKNSYIALINVQKSYNLLESVVNGLFTSLGFLIAIVIMAGIRERIDGNDIPESFKGMPIVLITAGLMSIAFFGFSGLV